MAQQLTLEAEKRESTGSAEVRRLRKRGIVPAIVYGGKQRNYPIQLNAKRIGDILKESASEQILVTLQIEGAEEKEKLALIQDIQHDHLNGQILHIDFNAVLEDQEIHASIPIELDGDPVGVKQGGVLEQLLRELPIACLPKHLPELIHVDVSALDVGDG
ncbi:MAG: 50S ribosomal protein L25, partial [Verrucomicrobiota bacterium]